MATAAAVQAVQHVDDRGRVIECASEETCRCDIFAICCAAWNATPAPERSYYQGDPARMVDMYLGGGGVYVTWARKG